MGFLYRGSSLTCDSITKTFTHSLSQTATYLNAYITPKSSGQVYVTALGVNDIQVRGSADTQTFDLTVIRWHSIQGGPAPNSN